MARPLRITFPGAFYHITSRGNERKPVFKNRRDRIKFLEYLGTATTRYDARIHIYCLMDNHYHLLLETPSGNLPQVMHHINGAYTTYFNVKHHRSGHLFQGRYKSILIEEDEYAKELSRYIHLNPVRAQMVSVPEDYEWSSYNQYIGKNKLEKWLFRDFVLNYFGKNRSTAQKGYKNFVNRLTGQEYDNPLKDVIGSALLGSRDFIHFITDQYLSELSLSKDLPAVRSLLPMLSMQDICRAVEKVFGDKKSMGRKVKIYLYQKYTGAKLRVIGNQFGIGESGVSQVCKRLEARIAQDKSLSKKIKRIEKKIKL